jgi:hypothetical protein
MTWHYIRAFTVLGFFIGNILELGDLKKKGKIFADKLVEW